MTRFEYVAKSTSGAQRTSFLYAESATAAADILHRDGLVVLSISEAKKSGTGGAAQVLLPEISDGEGKKNSSGRGETAWAPVDAEAHGLSP